VNKDSQNMAQTTGSVPPDQRPPPAARRPDPSVVLFDGLCNLCSRSVQFIITRDRGGRFRFASIGSDAATRALSRLSQTEPLPDSVVLIEQGRVFTRSTAALRIARHLRFPWSLAYVLVVVPRPIRDWIYTRIARRRYRWFGKSEVCMVPTQAMRERFLT